MSAAQGQKRKFEGVDADDTEQHQKRFKIDQEAAQDDAKCPFILMSKAIPPELLVKVKQALQQDDFFPKDRNKLKPMFGKTPKVPRDEVVVGPDQVDYVYSGHHVQFAVECPAMKELREWAQHQVKAIFGYGDNQDIHFDFALCNRYLDGKDAVGWHADDEKTIDQRFPIVSISLGATRRFRVKSKKSTKSNDDDKEQQWSMDLTDGNVIIMLPGMQDKYLHTVPKTTKPVGTRWNVTFRVYKK